MHPLLVSLGVSLLLASVYGSKGCLVLYGGCFSSDLRCWENSVTRPPPPHQRLRAHVRVYVYTRGWGTGHAAWVEAKPKLCLGHPDSVSPVGLCTG